MKLTCVIQICISMLPIKYDINTRSIFFTGSLKIFRSYGRKFLKSILTYLYCANYNEINMHHSDTQKHVSHEK